MQQLQKATIAMLDRVNDIYIRSREQLLEQEIFQWDESYPNKDYFESCIEEQDLLVWIQDDKVVGHVVLNEWQSEEWECIPWQGKHPLIIHSLMIDPIHEGKGLGSKMVKACEEFARIQGYKSMRLDAFSGNRKAIYLYNKLGYEKRGSVFFDSKPKGHQEYICMEKEL